MNGGGRSWKTVRGFPRTGGRNFGRVHMTLRVTPAMEVAVANHVWSIEEIVALLA
jgi:hypothetical protein